MTVLLQVVAKHNDDFPCVSQAYGVKPLFIQCQADHLQYIGNTGRRGKGQLEQKN